MNKYLIKLANHLDKKGLHKEADYVDVLLKRYAATPIGGRPPFPPPVTPRKLPDPIKHPDFRKHPEGPQSEKPQFYPESELNFDEMYPESELNFDEMYPESELTSDDMNPMPKANPKPRPKRKPKFKPRRRPRKHTVRSKGFER